jgi:hypothetical protein
VQIFGFLTGLVGRQAGPLLLAQQILGVYIFLHLAVKIKFLFQCQKLEFGDIYATEMCD